MLGNPEVHERDRQITRYIHSLMWDASFQAKKHLFGSFIMRWPANVVADILLPLFVAYGLEAIITNNTETVGTYALIIVLLGLLYGLMWGLGGLWICRGAVTAAVHLQTKVFRNYLSKDYEFFGDAYVGALGSQANRMRDALNEYNQAFVLHAPRQFIIVFFSIVVIAIESLLLALVTFLCMGIVLSYTLATSRWRLRYRQKLSEQGSYLAGVIGDALGHGETVKSFAHEEYEAKKLHKALKPWSVAQYRAWLTSIPADIGRTLLAALTVAALLLLTAHLYRQGDISLAIVALVQLYVLKMIAATHDISQLLKDYESTMGSIYQAVKTMLEPVIVADPPRPKHIPKPGRYNIQFHNVSFSYRNSKRNVKAVRDFNLTLKHGEKVGLVGYSGSGKTTLTKLLLRFMDVTDGSINVNGVDIRNTGQKELRNLISYVPQEPLLFHRSVADNIAYGRPSASRHDIEKAARAAYVEQFVNELPDKYDTLVGERGIKLSGGQRQRVAIARALLKDAPVLVLDEATSALDSKSERYIQEALWKLMKGRTALVIAHRLSTIQRMDRIVVMNKGKIVQTGTHDELKKQPGIYADLWEHQSGGYIGIPEPA